jgi:hypothetical protein
VVIYLVCGSGVFGGGEGGGFWWLQVVESFVKEVLVVVSVRV